MRDLVEAADLNALLRSVDGMCAAREWDELIDLAEACEDALERGKQLWPISAHIDYRIALEAPGSYAASVLDGDGRTTVGRFAPGPLTEVAASTHTWNELADHVTDPVTASSVAQERALRGERLDDDPRAHAAEIDLPLHLESWEPVYALPTFRASLVEVPEPWEPKSRWEELDARPGEAIPDDDVEEALLELVSPWTSESNGAARVAVVEGGAASAVAPLTLGPVRLASIGLDEALQRMAWAAAGGGAYGRRRGAAFGRFSAWYTAALLADLPWPSPSSDVGEHAARLRWYVWEEEGPEEGWVLRMAVEDPEGGWSAAIGATDVPEAE